MTNNWLTGIYLTTDEVLKYPDYVERLRDEIGLNTVVLSFTGQLSEEVLALSPYGGRTPTEEELGKLVIRHFDGRPIDPREYPQAQALCGPGVAAQGDDEAFRRAVGQLKEGRPECVDVRRGLDDPPAHVLSIAAGCARLDRGRVRVLGDSVRSRRARHHPLSLSDGQFSPRAFWLHLFFLHRRRPKSSVTTWKRWSRTCSAPGRACASSTVPASAR